jgi:hypothetical protein
MIAALRDCSDAALAAVAPVDADHETTSVECKNRRKRLVKSNSRSQGVGTESASLFAEWLGSGYFGEPRTLSDVHERFHDEGKIVPMTSIPSYLLKAVRKKQLRRKKQKVGSKFVWVYQSIQQ